MANHAKGSRPAFTLIELLVVLAIISILTMIAVPSMRTSQTRAKISRVKADLNTIATAVEAFAADNNKYPSTIGAGNDCTSCTGGYGGVAYLGGLSKPVRYLDVSQVSDPFSIKNYRTPFGQSYLYARSHGANERGDTVYILYSIGPSHRILTIKRIGLVNLEMNPLSIHEAIGMRDYQELLRSIDYDPSNGTYSRGYIMRLK